MCRCKSLTQSLVPDIVLTLTQWLLDMSKAWLGQDQPFTLVFRHIERLVERPEVCAGLSRASKLWEDVPKYRLPVIEDNIVHVRHLAGMMVREGLFDQHVERHSIEQALRRMWALLALAMGTCNEPGILCTLVDVLLEGLAVLLCGFVDPKLEVESMRRAMALMDDGGPSASGSGELLDISKDRRARVLFAELARMYRGAFILGVAQVNVATHNSMVQNQQLWFEALVKWVGDCGHPSCRRQLDVLKIPYGTVKNGKQQERWSITISVDDARVGFPEERSVELPFLSFKSTDWHVTATRSQRTALEPTCACGTLSKI